ncbi:MAG: zinc-ribbon domain-containing protein, partial [Planctomycetota bacterium]
MYCPKCGTENADDARVCRSCSWALTNVTTAAAVPAAKTSGLAIASLVLGLLSPLT